jgi:hypothetical protein
MVLRSPGPIAAAVVLSIVFAGCDEEGGGKIIAVGVSSPTPVVSAAVVPSTLPFQILPVLGCPFASPFASNFSLIVEPAGVDLILTEVGLQFVDAFGAVSPLTFSQNDLTLLFGSPVVTAGMQRSFPFQTKFGCGFTAFPQLMIGRFVFTDRRGGQMERTLTAQVNNSPPR